MKNIITVTHDETAGVWVSYCKTFDLYMQGTTREEALEALCEAQASWVMICHERGILTRALDNLQTREKK